MTRTQLKKKIVKSDSNIDRTQESSLGHRDGHRCRGDHCEQAWTSYKHTECSRTLLPAAHCNQAAPKEGPASRNYCERTPDTAFLPTSGAGSVLGCMWASHRVTELWDLMFHGFAHPKSLTQQVSRNPEQGLLSMSRRHSWKGAWANMKLLPHSHH